MDIFLVLVIFPFLQVARRNPSFYFQKNLSRYTEIIAIFLHIM